MNLTSSQQLLLDSARLFVRREYGFAQRQALAFSESGYSREHWALFARQGWLALPFAQSDGGLGGNTRDLILVLQAFGEGLVVEPYIPTVVAAGSLMQLAANDEQRAYFVGRIAEGSLLASVALYERPGGFELTDVRTRVRRELDCYLLDGTKSLVWHAAASDWLLVSACGAGLADDPQALSLLVVPGDAAGISRRDYVTLDGQRASEVRFDAVRLPVEARLDGDASSAIAGMFNRVVVALCAEALGAMQALLTITVNYCKTRRQFDQAIGSNQVLQHRLVDMQIAIEEVRALLWVAASAVDDDPPRVAARATSALKTRTGEAGRWIGEQAVQLHGAVGFSAELNVGQYYKRLVAIEAQYGSVDDHLRRFLANDALPT